MLCPGVWKPIDLDGRLSSRLRFAWIMFVLTLRRILLQSIVVGLNLLVHVGTSTLTQIGDLRSERRQVPVLRTRSIPLHPRRHPEEVRSGPIRFGRFFTGPHLWITRRGGSLTFNAYRPGHPRFRTKITRLYVPRYVNKTTATGLHFKSRTLLSRRTCVRPGWPAPHNWTTLSQRTTPLSTSVGRIPQRLRGIVSIWEGSKVPRTYQETPHTAQLRRYPEG